MDSKPADKLTGTVVIADFADRRARDASRDDALAQEVLEAGAKLGRYLIVERLGGGGMGVVYKAQDTELQRTVALKVLPPQLCRQPEYLNRFRAEAQAQARLNHPNVTTLYSLLELPAGLVLVLEYSDGQTLEQRIKSGGPLSAGEAIRVFDQALRGVDHIHAKGVVHRDLKPGNIFITNGGQVKLIDFGVAKIVDRSDHGAHRTMVGTLLYISPEQINGRVTDYRSDIYTLGVSLFEAVTGRLPFERRTDYALMHAHVQERPPRPKEYQRGLPRALETVILKAIEKEPDRRYQSAAEFRRVLLRLGLSERRERMLATRADPESTVGVAQFGFRLPDLGSSLRRRGLWLDAGLIATVVGLVFALGIFPLKPAIQDRPAAVAAATAKPAIQASVAAPKRQAAAPAPAATRPRIAPVSAPVSTPPAKPAHNYDALRKAWGG